MKLGDALAGVTKLGLDTSAFIYFAEANPVYVGACREVFRILASGRVAGYTSVLTLTEVLVQPIRTSDAVLEADYRRLLLSTNGVTCLPIDVSTAHKAASVRATHALHTPDAIQVAAALSVGCEAFLTNDAALRRVTELRVLLLDDLTL